MSAVVTELHRASGMREILSLSADCIVLLVQGDETTIELAVRSAELPSVLQALESRSGGGWRVPPSLALDVVRAESIRQ
jgi:soluble lytic murein transglycosylase-like protein